MTFGSSCPSQHLCYRNLWWVPSSMFENDHILFKCSESHAAAVLTWSEMSLFRLVEFIYINLIMIIFPNRTLRHRESGSCVFPVNLKQMDQEPGSYSCPPPTLNCKRRGAARGVIELLGEIWGKISVNWRGGAKLLIVAAMSVSSGGLQNVAWDPNPSLSAPPTPLSPHHEAVKRCCRRICSSQSKINHRERAGDLPGNPPRNTPSRWRCRTLSLAASALKRETTNESTHASIKGLGNVLLQKHYMAKSALLVWGS